MLFTYLNKIVQHPLRQLRPVVSMDLVVVVGEELVKESVVRVQDLFTHVRNVMEHGLVLNLETKGLEGETEHLKRSSSEPFQKPTMSTINEL